MSLDLRHWLKKVEEMGELRRVAGADWDLEIGCINRLNAQAGPRNALLFDPVKDYPEGYQLLTSSLSTPSRTALTFNLPHDTPENELLDVFRKKLLVWQNEVTKYPPREVKKGLVTENVNSGDEINLLKFPVPRWHDLDGGRYIGTGCAVITRDIDSGDINIGCYRIMLHNRNTVGFYSSPGKHGRIHYEKYHEQNKSCPVAISIGHHPLIFAVAGVEFPHYPASEFGSLGAVLERPIDVIIDEVTGLPIPADSEIVITGWCPPDKSLPEGPFGEFTGYYGSKQGLAPIIDVQRVYHRNNPVLLGGPPERTPGDHTYYLALLKSAMLHNVLINNGFPDVKKVWVDEMGHQIMAVISLKQRFAGQSKQIALCAAQSRALPVGRYIMVVDEDIDPANIRDVIWALCTRTDPIYDIDIIQRAWFSPLDPTVPERPAITLRSKAVIDACIPFERLNDYPDPIRTDPALIQNVKEKWGKALDLH